MLLTSVLGCVSDQEGYPRELTYPPRDTPLVLQTPRQAPTAPYAPGQLDQELARLPEQGGHTLDPKQLSTVELSKVSQLLTASFGTPAEPLVTGTKAIDQLAEILELDAVTLERGSTLYRRSCLHCHGIVGNGRGPTGPWIKPHPRDFRRGVFKFVSTPPNQGDRPCRADLLRTLEQGLPGSSMPAFGRLDKASLQALVSYTIHLSLRGEVEFYLLRMLLTEDAEVITQPLDVVAQNQLQTILMEWKSANELRLEPNGGRPEVDNSTPSAEDLTSIRRGHELFINPQGAGCIACHVDYGRNADYRYDVWGLITKPRDLTEPVYRGGNRPQDIYWRLRHGIGPSGMPAFTHLQEEQIWDLVRLVRALPYPARLPEDVRAEVYPSIAASSGE